MNDRQFELLIDILDREIFSFEKDIKSLTEEIERIKLIKDDLKFMKDIIAYGHDNDE